MKKLMNFMVAAVGLFVALAGFSGCKPASVAYDVAVDDVVLSMTGYWKLTDVSYNGFDRLAASIYKAQQDENSTCYFYVERHEDDSLWNQQTNETFNAREATFRIIEITEKYNSKNEREDDEESYVFFERVNYNTDLLNWQSSYTKQDLFIGADFDFTNTQFESSITLDEHQLIHISYIKDGTENCYLQFEGYDYDRNSRTIKVTTYSNIKSSGSGFDYNDEITTKDVYTFEWYGNSVEKYKKPVVEPDPLPPSGGDDNGGNGENGGSGSGPSTVNVDVTGTWKFTDSTENNHGSLTFKADGSYTYSGNRATAPDGTYSVSGNKLRFKFDVVSAGYTIPIDQELIVSVSDDTMTLEAPDGNPGNNVIVQYFGVADASVTLHK